MTPSPAVFPSSILSSRLVNIRLRLHLSTFHFCSSVYRLFVPIFISRCLPFSFSLSTNSPRPPSSPPAVSIFPSIAPFHRRVYPSSLSLRVVAGIRVFYQRFIILRNYPVTSFTLKSIPSPPRSLPFVHFRLSDVPPAPRSAPPTRFVYANSSSRQFRDPDRTVNSGDKRETAVGKIPPSQGPGFLNHAA